MMNKSAIYAKGLTPYCFKKARGYFIALVNKRGAEVISFALLPPGGGEVSDNLKGIA